MKKNVLLLGATGTAGSAVRQKLLKKTDSFITLVSRHASTLTPTPDREQIEELDVHDVVTLAKVIKGQDIIFSALSAENSDNELADLATNIVTVMDQQNVHRLIFMVAMGIYNEIPQSVGPQDNVDNNPMQIHNLKAAQVVEKSDLDYTLLRPGFLVSGSDEVVITHKGELVSGNTTSTASVGEVVGKLVTNENLGIHESLGLNQP
ncbi:NAD(P)H-binding protein [Companilactobacillus furfuricola]|uniref:NAD(P)H-binding protein n=1 Tax=Companilactobacillus furfuricola TaxID=1462575 RepID=UPI0013DE7593|nr:NAD(P)H-binding protein [Companilactobacillus furfuricola]